MVGNFKPGDISHLDLYRKKSITRQKSLMSLSSISQRSISHHDIRIEVATTNSEVHLLNIEDCLDLALCMAFNPLNKTATGRFNPFKLHFAQQIAQGKLGFYIWIRYLICNESPWSTNTQRHKLILFKEKRIQIVASSKIPSGVFSGSSLPKSWHNKIDEQMREKKGF